jgi:hypothetical protein
MRYGGESVRRTIIRPRLASFSSGLIYQLFTIPLLAHCTLLSATVRHNPEQMLGHVLGHAPVQKGREYGA